MTLGAGGTVTLGGGGNITLGGGGNVTLGAGGTVTLGAGGNITLGAGGTVTLGGGGNITLGAGGTITLGGGGTVTLGAGGNVTLGAGGGTINGVADGPGTYPVGAGGTVTLGAGGNVTLGAGGNVTLGAGGNVTLGAGGNITLGGGGTVTLGGGGNVTLGAGGVVTLGGGGNITLGGGGNITLGGGGNITLGGGGNVTLGGGGAASTELDYNTANSIVRPPPAATYTLEPSAVQVNWTAPAFGVVQTYTISRSVNGGSPVIIGSVSGVNGFAPATTFTDTNPDTSATTVVYTISTTLAPDPGTSNQRQSAPSPPAVLTVDQTIVLGSLPSSVSISNPSITVYATAETNGSANMQLVTFTASGPCSVGTAQIDQNGVSSTPVTLSSTGSCTITASQTGDSTIVPVVTPAYNAATPVSGTFTIVPVNSNTTSQTIAFPQLPPVQYGSSPVPVSATASSNLPVTFSVSGPCSLTGNAIAITGAGKCSVTASAPSGPGPNKTTYSAASATQSFNISPAVLTVTAGSLTISYGQPVPSLATDYTITGYVNSESSSVLNSTAPAISTTATSSSAPGSYPITVSTGSLAATNYSFLYVSGTLTIQSTNQSALVLSAASALTYNQSEPLNISGGSTGGAITYNVTGPCSVANGQLTANSSTGSCTVSATMAGNSSYSPVTSNSVIVTLQVAAQTINFTTNPPSSAAYNSQFTVGGTASSGLAISFTSAGGCTNSATTLNSGVYTSTYTMTSSTVACSVIAGQAGNSNYGAQTVTKTVAATGPAITVSPTSINFGAVTLGSITIKTVTVSNTGNAAVTISTPFISLLTAGNADEFVIVSLCPSSLAAGKSCTITVSFVAGAYYNTAQTATLEVMDNAPGSPQPVALSATVLQPQKITFSTNPPASAVYNSSFTVAASASSGLAVTYTSSGSCSNSGATYTMTGGKGACSVIVNQAGNSNYAAAGQVTKTVTATLAPQTITFTTSPPASAVFKSTFTVAASGGASGNAVTFTSSGACSNSGATYMMTSGKGTCSVIANQAGNSNYAAAGQVTKTVSATYSLASLSPTSLSFGTVGSGRSSSAQIATLANTGTSPLIISNIGFTGTNPGNFSQTSTCPGSASSLAAGAKCTISVTFNSGGKAVSANLTVTDNTQAGTQSVSLSGN